jgi:hypothetical protein
MAESLPLDIILAWFLRLFPSTVLLALVVPPF